MGMPMWIAVLLLLVGPAGVTLTQDRLDEYRSRLADLEEDDADGHFDLGIWCKEKRLKKEAREQFQKVIEIDPDHEGAHLELDHVRYEDEWLPEKEAKARERQDVGWEFRDKVETDHCLIYYGTSEKTARKLATYGEALHTAFEETFGDVMDYGAHLPLKVYAFRTKDQYRDYLKAHAPGLGSTLYAQYDPMTRTAYICEEGSSENFLIQSLVHENTHALTGRLMGYGWGTSSWLMEGWADYMALSVDFRKKTLEPGKISQTKKSRHPDMVKRLLKEGQAVPLADLVEMNRMQFARLGLRTYPQAWALFHFLRHHGDGEYRDRLDEYIRKVAEGKGGKAMFEETIGPLETIEKEWRDYVRTLSSSRTR